MVGLLEARSINLQLIIHSFLSVIPYTQATSKIPAYQKQQRRNDQRYDGVRQLRKRVCEVVALGTCSRQHRHIRVKTGI